MASGFLAGFEVIAGEEAGTFTAGVPKRLVLHTTEGSSIAGAVAEYRKKRNCFPHFTVDAGKRQRAQHYPVDVSARALHKGKPGVQTNPWGAIQIEMVGFAKSSHLIPHAQLAWLATEVIGPILAAVPSIKLHHPKFKGEGEGLLAHVNAKQRMTPETWKAFDGICGHQHVPENDHWDPGRFPIDTVLGFLGAPTNPFLEEDDMTFITTPDKRIVLLHAGKLVHIGKLEGIDADVNSWDLSKDEATWKNLQTAYGGVVG
jgi:hypothetical protein